MGKNITLLVALLFASTSAAIAAAGGVQARPKVFIGAIEGPDQFICERYQMLFMEELTKTKSVDVVAEKEAADFVLTGIGRLDEHESSGVHGSANENGAVISGSSGTTPNALLSIKLVAKDGRVVFVGNKSSQGSVWSDRGATQDAVFGLVKEMKKRMNWK